MRRPFLPAAAFVLLVMAAHVRAEPARRGDLTDEQREALTSYFENNSKFVDLAKKPLEALESSHAEFLSKYSDALLVVRISNDLAETRDWEALKKLAEKLEDAPLKALCPNLHNALGWIGWVKSGMELLKDLVIDPALEQQAIDIYANNRKALEPPDAYANSRVYGLMRLRNIERFRKQYGDQAFVKGSKDELLPRWNRRLEEFSAAWLESQYQLRMVEEARRAFVAKRQQAEKDLAELDRQVRALLQDKAGKLAAAKCPAKSAPTWNEDKSEVRCVCVTGYRWEGGPACVPDRAALMATTRCDYPRSELFWDDRLQEPRCRCQRGYMWNGAGKECVVDKVARVAATDCSSHPASRAYWDDEANDTRCRWCLNGYHWARADGLDCEPDAQPDTAEADSQNELAANIERAATQIFQAESDYQHRMRQINDEWGRQRSDLDQRRGGSGTQASGKPDLQQCIQCVNGLVGGKCYARIPRLAGWGLCISCREDGGVEEENKFIDRNKCPACKDAGWKLEDFRAYRHN